MANLELIKLVTDNGNVLVIIVIIILAVYSIIKIIKNKGV